MKKLSCVAFVVVVCGFVGASAAADHAMFNKVSPDISKPVPSPHPEGWVPLARAGGETCATATVIGALPYSDDGTTLGAVDDYEEVCPYTSTSGDVVYSYSPAADVTVDATLCAGVTDYDTKLFVYQDVCPDGVPFACNDDECTAPGGQGFVSELAGLNLLGGHTYYFVVDGYSGEEGNYTLEIAEGQPWASLNPCGATDLLFGQDPHNDDGGWSFGSSTAAAWAAPGYAVYDNLETTQHEVCGINFHGLSLFNGGSWAACDPTAGGGMPFTIGFYPDAAGQPNTAAAICEYTGVIPNSITDSGLLFNGFSMYSFAVDALPSCCQLPASGTVWMMVRNEAMTGDCAFLWASSGNGLGDSSWQYDYDLATWDDTSGVDRAMCLYGTFWPVELQSFSIQ
jgi:hypothetical protein